MSTTDGDSVPGGLGARWKSLVARPRSPDDITGPLGDVIRLFGDIGLARHLADPANARDQCIRVSTLFESMLAHRGIPAETVDGFCFARVPPFEQEAMVAGHTAVKALAPDRQPDADGEIVIDWTARQFHPGAPVPLIVTLTDWRAFWRDLAATDEAQKDEQRAVRRPPRRPRPAIHARGAANRNHGRTAG